MKKSLLLALLIISASCSTSKTKLSSEGAKVELQKRAPKNCTVVAKVEGQNDQGSVDLARNHARNLAADEGADSLYIEDEFSNGGGWRVLGTAYKCN